MANEHFRLIRRWPSGMFKVIGTGGRGFEPRPGLAVPQETATGMAHFSIMRYNALWPMMLSRVVKIDNAIT